MLHLLPRSKTCLTIVTMAAAGLGASAFGGTKSCTGDVVPSGTVNVDDLLAIISSWGRTNVTHSVTASDALEFVPATVDALAGDTITWGVAFNHTVTSGTMCNPDGQFNENLFSPFSFAIPNPAPASIGYFCMPHCAFGMSGTINVEPFPEDVVRDGTVNVDDLLGVIGNWGVCD